tara:strand:+ start:506 stop:685 length:180 start_codon:yes stop_codon:yes gene_type:complete
MKLSYETKDKLIKFGFITMIIVFITMVGYSYVSCQVDFVDAVISETPKNIEESVKAKMK